MTYLVNSSQAEAASYRYDPYGRLMGSSGTLAAANRYRFSSKELHAKSGMYYYGFRFYEPHLQRWINRDPIREKGGINLYRFLRNAPPQYVDPLGLTIRFDPSSPSSFIEHWRNCICRLMQSPTGYDLVRRAAGPGIDIVITPSPQGPIAGSPYYRGPVVPEVGIGLDPTDPLGISPTNPNIPPVDELPPANLSGCAVVLAHELGHASEDEEDELYGGRNVHLYENPVRRELGLPPRQRYHGIPIFLW